MHLSSLLLRATTDSQTLPIGYYPTLTDESLDKVLLDQSQYTVEWMVTPAAQAKVLDERALLVGNHYVSTYPTLTTAWAALTRWGRCRLFQLRDTTRIHGLPNRH